ncbi:MAG: glycosyltransferase family 39 protein, partial [Polyangia bacterium]
CSLLVVLLTAGVIGLGARRIAGRDAGLLAALFYGVFSSVYYSQMIAANTEVFMLLPLIGSAVLLLRRPFANARLGDLLFAGALIGLACVWKQVALVNAVLLLAVAWMTRTRLLGMLAALTGLLIGVGIPLLAVWRWASLEGMWHWAFVRVLTHYGPVAWSPSRYFYAAITTGALFVVSTIPLWVGVVLRLRSTRAYTQPELFLLAWCGLSAVAVAAGGHFLGHYYLQLVAPLSLLAAVELSTSSLSIVWHRALLAITFTTATIFLCLSPLMDPIEGAFSNKPAIYRAVAAYVRDHTRPDDRIFVWGAGAPIYEASGRLCATRFVGFLRGIDRAANESPALGWDCGAEVWPLLLEDFATHPPVLFVDTAPSDLMHFARYPISRFPALANFVSERYDREATVAGTVIWRLRATPRH